MTTRPTWRSSWLGLLLMFAGLPALIAAESVAVLEVVQGKVEYSPAGSSVWRTAKAGQKLQPGDVIRTAARSRACLRWVDRTIYPLSERTTFQVGDPSKRGRAPSFRRGKGYLHNRSRPNRRHFRTRSSSAAIRGTDAVISVDENDTTTVALLDGEIGLTNEFGGLIIRSGETAVIELGAAPRKLAFAPTAEVIQWALYYPVVLNPAELSLPTGDQAQLAESLAAYRRGNLSHALRALPEEPLASSDARLYQAALELTVGRLTDRSEPFLQRLMAAVQRRPITELPPPVTASDWLAESYYQQSRADLSGALAAARRAAQLAPEFGSAWARVAELQFSFGRRRPARQAVEKALELSPDSAPAVALRGFLALADNQRSNALTHFNRAIKLDGAYPNAWFGRGLVKIRAGDRAGGRADLHLASALQPNLSLFRSYAGKAFQHEGQLEFARKEFARAKALDPQDPTPWLYSALLRHQENELAAAIAALEKSIALNDHRALYRSRLLLDQDRSVRSANLANIFDAAGFRDRALRESARAVMFDYGNYSAHRNLASSFDALRDPTRFSLRHETEWESEHLIASLLTPVGAGSLSQNYSHNEYSRVFTTSRLGLNSATEYFSQASQVRQRASFFGHGERLSYAFDIDYHRQGGFLPNDHLSRLEWYTHAKAQLSSRDSLLFRAKYSQFETGDNFQRYDPFLADPDLHFEEDQEPNLWLGYHREWRPGYHTLLLAGRLANQQRLRDLASGVYVNVVAPNPTTFDPFFAAYDLHLATSLDIWTAEWKQIMQRERHTDIFGLRYQNGQFDASSSLVNVSGFPSLTVPVNSLGGGDMERRSAYAYHTWEPLDGLLLTGGATYEDLTWPLNFRRPPLATGELTKERILPKLSIVYQPDHRYALRGIYAQALGGVSFDENIRLEPTQLAGFSQSFRSLVPESANGAAEAPEYEIWGAGMDVKLAAGRHLILEGGLRRQDTKRPLGVIASNQDAGSMGAFTSTNGLAAEEFTYRDTILSLRLDQIIPPHWFLSAGYQYTHSQLDQRYPGFPTISGNTFGQDQEATLHEASFSAAWIRPGGFFARAAGRWIAQDSEGFLAAEGDRFPQLDLTAGWIFQNRRGELALGILNVTDQDYRLNPLTPHLQFQRERTFYTRLKFNF